MFEHDYLPNPTVEEEREMFTRLASGDERALDLILRSYGRMAHKIASRTNLKIPGYDQDDLDSIALCALVEAARKFDLSKNLRFSTLAYRYMWGRINTEKRLYPYGAGIRCGTDFKDRLRREDQSMNLMKISLDGHCKGEDKSEDADVTLQEVIVDRSISVERRVTEDRSMENFINSLDEDHIDFVRDVIFGSEGNREWFKRKTGNLEWSNWRSSKRFMEDIEAAAWREGIISA